MGGTELRALVAHSGKLYAANGYWVDQPGPEGQQGAQILVLDAPHAQWRVDHDFDERMSNGRRRYLAVSTIDEVTFATDGSGQPLPSPVSMLIESNWDLTGQARIYTRDDASGVWSAIVSPAAPRVRVPGSRRPQVRSFGFHRDRVTGVDQVFVGLRPYGILSGTYDATAPGRIRLSGAPELNISSISDEALPGSSDKLRISSFAECNDRLYAAVGQEIYERIDGAKPRWRLIYSNPSPGRSETGLRGLTAIANPAGPGQVLIAAVEGSEGRIVRIDPHNGSEVTDLDLGEFLSKAWGMPIAYTIAAYNNFTKVHDSAGREVLLIGFEAFVPPIAPVAAGHTIVDTGHSHVESNAWYLVRRPNGHYDLHRISVSTGHPMIATRSIVPSPFLNDENALYFGGYDANRTPSHNTAWLVRATLETAVGDAQ
jgi:hypothetical protein